MDERIAEQRRIAYALVIQAALIASAASSLHNYRFKLLGIVTTLVNLIASAQQTMFILKGLEEYYFDTTQL